MSKLLEITETNTNVKAIAKKGKYKYSVAIEHGRYNIIKIHADVRDLDGDKYIGYVSFDGSLSLNLPRGAEHSVHIEMLRGIVEEVESDFIEINSSDDGADKDVGTPSKTV